MIRVERWIVQDLRREVWSFSMMGFGWDDGERRIVLSWWRIEVRPTRRHRKWVAASEWERLSSWNKAGPPKIPADVVAEVQAAVAARFARLPVVTG